MGAEEFQGYDPPWDSRGLHVERVMDEGEQHGSQHSPLLVLGLWTTKMEPAEKDVSGSTAVGPLAHSIDDLTVPRYFDPLDSQPTLRTPAIVFLSSYGPEPDRLHIHL